MVGSPLPIWLFKADFLAQITEQGMPADYVAAVEALSSNAMLIVLLLLQSSVVSSAHLLPEVCSKALCKGRNCVMNGEGKKHTLKVSIHGRKLLLLVAGKYCGLYPALQYGLKLHGLFSAPTDRCLRMPKIRRQTGNRIWNLSGATILCISKRTENFSQQLHNHCILCKKDFPLFDCRYNGITENARPGIDGCTSEMAYPAGIDYSFVCNCPIFSGFKRRNRLYPGCHEAP